MRSARLALFLLAALGMSLYAHAQDDELFGEDFGAESSLFDDDGEWGFGEEEYGTEEIGIGDEDYGFDDWGYYDTNYDYATDDEGFGDFYGESDEGWFDF
jgi:hypothetical protein